MATLADLSFDDEELSPEAASVSALPQATGKHTTLADLSWDDEELSPEAQSIRLAMIGMEPIGTTEEIGFLSNSLRGVAQGAADITAGLANVLSQEELADTISDINAGYEARYTWDRVKDSFNEGDILGLGQDVAGFVIEQGAKSLPAMVATLNPVTFGAYLTSLAGNIARDRTENDGRTDVTVEDIASDFPAAIASGLLEKFATSRVFGLKPGIQGKPGRLREAGRRGATEAGTEAVQESIEYAGETFGTEAGFDVEQMLVDRALAGAVAGGALGGAIGAAAGAPRTAEQIAAEEAQRKADKEEAAKPVVEPEEQQAVDDLEQPAPEQPAPEQPAPEQPTTPAAATVEPDEQQAMDDRTPEQTTPVQPAPVQPAPVQPAPVQPAPQEPLATAPPATSPSAEAVIAAQQAAVQPPVSEAQSGFTSDTPVQDRPTEQPTEQPVPRTSPELEAEKARAREKAKSKAKPATQDWRVLQKESSRLKGVLATIPEDWEPETARPPTPKRGAKKTEHQAYVTAAKSIEQRYQAAQQAALRAQEDAEVEAEQRQMAEAARARDYEKRIQTSPLKAELPQIQRIKKSEKRDIVDVLTAAKAQTTDTGAIERIDTAIEVIRKGSPARQADARSMLSALRGVARDVQDIMGEPDVLSGQAVVVPFQQLKAKLVPKAEVAPTSTTPPVQGATSPPKPVSEVKITTKGKRRARREVATATPEQVAQAYAFERARVIEKIEKAVRQDDVAGALRSAGQDIALSIGTFLKDPPLRAKLSASERDRLRKIQNVFSLASRRVSVGDPEVTQRPGDEAGTELPTSTELPSQNIGPGQMQRAIEDYRKILDRHAVPLESEPVVQDTPATQEAVADYETGARIMREALADSRDPTTRTSVNAKQFAGSMRDLLRTVDNPVAQMHADILDRVSQLPLDDVKVIGSHKQKAAGEYVQARRQISLSLRAEAFENPTRLGHTALHELLHAASVRLLRSDTDFAQRMDQLRRYAEQQIGPITDFGSSTNYGFADTYEFAVEVLANPDFQQLLAGIPAPPGFRTTSAIRNLYDVFVNAVRRAIKLPLKSTSVLEAALDASAVALDPVNYGSNLGKAKPLPKAELVGTVDGLRRTGFREREDADSFYLPESATFKSMSPRELASLPTRTRRIMAARGPDWRTKPRAAFLWAMELNAVQKFYRRYFVDPDTGRNYLTEFVKNVRERDGTFHKRQSENNTLMREWDNLSEPESELLGKIMHDSTLGMFHPDKAWTHADNQITVPRGHEEGRQAKHTATKRLYDDASPKIRKLYQKSQRMLEEDFNTRRVENLRFSARTNNVSGSMVRRIAALNPDPDVALREIEALEFGFRYKDGRPNIDREQRVKQDLRDIVESYGRKVPGPYFPLRRWGDYVVTGTTKINEEFDSVEDARAFIDKTRDRHPGAAVYLNEKDGIRVTGRIQYMEQVASQEDARNLQEMLKAEGLDVRSDRKEDFELPQTASLDQMLRAVESATQDEKTQHELKEAFKTLLPETRVLRSQLKREYVSGASRDMQKSLAQHFTAGNRAISSLMHSPDVHLALTSARGMADRASRANDLQRATLIRDVVTNLEARYHSAASSEIREVNWLRHVSQLSFLRYLADASYLMINMTQPLMTTYPELAGRYGQRAAQKAIYRAYKDLTPKVGKSFKSVEARTRIGKFGVPGLDPSTLLNDIKRDLNDPELANLIDRAQTQGVLSSLQAEEMTTFATAGEVGKIRGGVDKWSRLLSGPAQYVEFQNRLVTLLATYNLELSKNANPNDAINTAIDTTRDTQFDYSMANRPMWMHSGLGRIFGTFKMHALGMYTRLGEYTYRAVKGKSKAEKQMAYKQLATMLGMHTAIAGTAGGLFIEPLRLATYVYGLMFGDDDDFTEIWDNPDLWMREHFYELTGDKYLAQTLTHGLLPTLGARSNLSGLIFLDIPEPRETASDLTASIAGGVFGAPGRIVVDFAAGAGAFAEGDWNKAITKMLPFKQGTDLARMWKLQHDGITDSRGNVLVRPEDIDWLEKVGQAIGFTQTVQQEVYRGRAVKYSREQPAKERANFLRQQFYNASGSERADVMRQVRAFNRANPGLAISADSLFKGMRRRARQAMETRSGVYFHGEGAQMQFGPQTQWVRLP